MTQSKSNNIILTWMPGSWKTTIWKMLAEHINKQFLDFDDDVIEWIMWRKVSDILSWFRDEEKLYPNRTPNWDEKFLDLERDLACILELENTVLSTSWSVPLRPEAMKWLEQQGTIVYINTPTIIIEQRLNMMKVDRIVWMWRPTELNWTLINEPTIGDILKWREPLYQHYDYKIDLDLKWTIEEVLDFFLKEYKKLAIN